MSVAGKYLKQEAMAASNFNVLEEKKDINPDAQQTAQFYVSSKYTQEDIQNLTRLTGLDFNITPVPGGFVASVLSFDKTPEEKDLKIAAQKVFGEDKEMMYIPSEWMNHYVESQKYKGNLNELETSIGERMEGEGVTKFNIDYLGSVISTFKAISGQIEEGYGNILDSKKVINKLTKNNITLKRKGGFIEIPTFHFGGFIDVNRL